LTGSVLPTTSKPGRERLAEHIAFGTVIRKDEPALVSAADGAGSAMPGLGCGGDQARAGLGRSCNHVDSIGSQ